MKQKLSFCVALMFISLIVCKEDPTSNTPVATETWSIQQPNTQNTATLKLTKYDNGSILADGQWLYDFYGNLITCTFMHGAVAVKDTQIIINTSGHAAYPPDSSGDVESSDFQMSMTGKFKDGTSSGTWTIDFTKEEWQGWIEGGSFRGTLSQGQGVTE